MSAIKKVIQNRSIQHLLFWGLSFYVLLRIFSYEFPPQKVDYVYTFLFHLSLWCGVYFNLMILIPYLLRKGFYLSYFFSITVTLLLMVMINIWTFKVLSDWLFPGYYFISYYHFGDLIQFSLVYLVISSLLKLSKAWFEVNKKDRVIHELEKQKLSAELQALKHQIDPHFLFNSLNTIYSMNLEDNPQTGDAILQLSDNMRYVLYKANAPEVELSAEFEFIRNYLELQKARLGPGKADIRLEISPRIDQRINIAPLLFLPFIENAFKHGLRRSHEEAYIHIFFRKSHDALVFELHNSKALNTAPEKAEEGGIGLPTARKRLEVLYPAMHELRILDEEEKFSVYLSIDFL